MPNRADSSLAVQRPVVESFAGAEGAEYDGLDRLTAFRRGSLSADGNSIVSNPKGAQLWNLDALGNWRGFKDDATDGGTWDLEQTRSHNLVNELTGFAQGQGQPAWPAPQEHAYAGALPGDAGIMVALGRSWV